MKNLSIEHSFNVAVAEEVGVNAAIIMKSIQFWVEHNKANEKDFHEGRYWTYESMRAFEEQFPYLTMRKIETALKKLKERGFIVTGNYNATPYDRTKWYSVTDEYFRFVSGKPSGEPVNNPDTEEPSTIPTKCEIEKQNLSNQKPENVEPIPDTIQILSDTNFDSYYDTDSRHSENETPIKEDQEKEIYYVHQTLWDETPAREKKKICQTDDRKFSKPLIKKLLDEGMSELDFRDAVKGIGITKRPSFWLKDSLEDILRFRSLKQQPNIE